MRIKQGLFGVGLLAFVGLTHATTWTAESSHVGKVNAGISGGAVVQWQCDGQRCEMSGPWGAGLSMESCQQLVAKVGPIQSYGNSAGQAWAAGSAELAQCNQPFRAASAIGMNTWYAQSKHQGQVITQIPGGVQVVWNCNGRECAMTGPWGVGLSLEACQDLTRKIGKIQQYRNSTGQQWKQGSKALAACNAVAP